MKYEVGDDIIVLLSNEEGKVVEIMNDKMVMIEVRGVKFPAYMDQIDFPYFYRFSKKKIVEPQKTKKVYVDNIPKEKPKPNEVKVADGVWLRFIPQFELDDFNDEVVELLKIHLVNNTTKGYTFEYNQYFFGEASFQLKNEILPFHDFYLHDISFASVNDSPSFCIDFSLMNKEKNKAAHFETNLKLKPKQVFNRIEELKANNESMISYALFDEYPDEVITEKFELSSLAAKGFKIYEAHKIRQNLESARSVVDLHIEKITNDYKHLSNFEILTIQLKEFEKWYDLAIVHHQPTLVVIHGVGKGKLREEIHEILKLKKEVKYFVNQYDPRFGYGATEIFFSY
jgi:dsDNA-specific endonuclease/ATPase MutS2